MSKICGKNEQKWVVNLEKPHEKDAKVNSQYQKALENQRKWFRNLKIHWTAEAHGGPQRGHRGAERAREAPKLPENREMNNNRKKKETKEKRERTPPMETRGFGLSSWRSEFFRFLKFLYFFFKKKNQNHWKIRKKVLWWCVGWLVGWCWLVGCGWCWLVVVGCWLVGCGWCGCIRQNFWPLFRLRTNFCSFFPHIFDIETPLFLKK